MNMATTITSHENTALMIAGEFVSMEWLTETPPEHEFCVNPLLPIGAVTLLNAHGGTGKSLFSLKMAVHITLGLSIIGAETNGGKVAYMSLEDSENTVRERIFKIVNALPEEIKERVNELTTKLMIIDRYGIQTHMAENDGGNIVTAQIAHELSALLKRHNIRCVFVDTFIRTNALNENDNAQMGALLVAFEGIAKDAECAVVLIHHLPKHGGSKEYAARGASAITDNARSSMLLWKVDVREVEKFTEERIITAAREGRLLGVTHTKHNYSAKHPDQYLEMTTAGILQEVFPASRPAFSLGFLEKRRYKELYDWYEAKWESKPLSKTHINENIESIKPAKSLYGRRFYEKALEWAVEQGYAKEVPAPTGGSRNSKATYYILTRIEEQESPNTPVTPH